MLAPTDYEITEFGKGPCADSVEKHEPASDVATVVMESLKALDPNRPIREADSCTAAILSLFDHPVSAARHRKPYGKAKCVTGFQIERWKGISIDMNFKFDAAQQLPARCRLFQF
jgi:hypothetical protein